MSAHAPPAQIIQAIEAGQLEPVFCETVLRGYLDVLARPRFQLRPETVAALLEQLAMTGIYIEPESPVADFKFPDDADIPFYRTALAAGCTLTTGNLKHFPADGPVEELSPREVVKRYL